MELRHLRYFVHVAEEQHYGRAAERLRIAQPALSRQIQDLEEEIGFKLFDRLPRGVKISAAGKSFLVDARRILHEVSGGIHSARRTTETSAGIGNESSSDRTGSIDQCPPTRARQRVQGAARVR